MTISKKHISPTFVEVGARGHLGAARRRSAHRRPVPPPPALSAYNALAVKQYSPTFVDISLEPDTGRRRTVAPLPPRGLWEVLQSRRWGWGLARGTAMASSTFN